MNWNELPESGDVIRDAAGVPVEWTLLKVGENPICRDGEDGVIDLTRAGVDKIVEYFTKKGEEIPVDSEHYLYTLAEKKKLDESEALRLFPGGVAALGFGKLFADPNGALRIRVKWTPAAYEMMKEKIYKYFSPVIRGLEHGPLRVTSVAMTNTPAINQLDALAARAENNSPGRGRKEAMSKLEKALGRLLGRESIALSAECEKEDDAIACEIEEKASLIEEVKKLLKLPPDATLETVIAALKAEAEKAASADEKQQELDKLAEEQEKKAYADLVKKGTDEGKITPGDLEYVNSLDSKALSAYLDHTSVKVPLKRLSAVPRVSAESDHVTLTAEDNDAIERLHLDREAFLKAKTERMK